MLESTAGPLRTELLALFRRGMEPLDDDAFNRLALRVFAYNFHHVSAYAGYCRARDRSPDDVRHWLEIPAVPTAAFREVPLLARGAVAERVFRTSGTTAGPEQRGTHAVPDLELYRGSLRPTFKAHLLPDDARLPVLSLMPPAPRLPQSSLAFMISDVMQAYGTDGSRAYADTTGLDADALTSAARSAAREGQPVLLLGTSAAFIHWLDRLEAESQRLELAEGSRLMDTGGYKGKGRQLEPWALRAWYRDRLGLPSSHCVNEYGMTEMLSQLYDGTLRESLLPLHQRPGAPSRRTERRGSGKGSRFDGAGADAGGTEPRLKMGPPWLRSVAVEPETLEPLPDGDTGLLRHFDLANLGGVAAIQTEDQGRVVDGAVQLMGRAAGAPPRGCSIAMDLLLSGTR